MQKKQKKYRKKTNQRSYKDFIRLIKLAIYDFMPIPDISNIYGLATKDKEIEVYRLPLWRDVTDVQRLAYFFYFMSETKEYKSVKPFTLNLSKEFRDKYKTYTYKQLKSVIIKRIFGNLDYKIKSRNKPMMAFILENKTTKRRKDITDKETHILGIREILNEEDDRKVQLSLKTSVCCGKKEYKRPEYRNMLQTSEYQNNKLGAIGWMMYLNKGVCSNNGLYISNSLLKKIKNSYTQVYNDYVNTLKNLKHRGYKVRYKNTKSFSV